MMATPYISRLGELQFFENFLHEPGFSAILVEGEGGIGKTSLARNFSEIASQEGHWVHFFPLYSSQPSALPHFVAEALSSGKYLIGKEANQWKEILQSNQEINNLLLSLLPENSSETDITYRLEAIIDLITQQISVEQKLLIIFDGIEATKNSEKSVLFLESMLSSFSNNSKLKLIFLSRPFSTLGRLHRYPNLRTLPLAGFTYSDMVEYISRALPDAAVPEKEFLDNIWTTTAGLPLLIALIIAEAKHVGIENALATSPISLYDLLDRSFRVIEKDTANVLLFMKAIALLDDKANPAIVMELLEMNASDLSSLVADVVRRYSFLMLEQDGSIRFIHASIRDFIIQKYIFPEEFKSTLLDFGSEEAERDHLLETNFVFTGALTEIISGKKNIILGDRGAGKSAIFRYISDYGKFPVPDALQNQYPLSSKKVLIVPLDDPLSIVQNSSVFDDTNPAPEKFKLFWLLYIALLSGAAIYKQGNYTNPANWKDLTDILKNTGFLDKIKEPDSSLFGPLLDLITKVGSKVSFSIAGIPITLEPSAELKSEKSKTVIDISKLLELSDLIAENLDQRIIILIDRLDEIFKYEREKQEKFVQGLFLAVSYLAKYSNLSLTVFLRTDIFQVYDIQEKNKYVSRSLNLTWNQKDILRLLLSRLEANEIFQGLRPFIRVDSNSSESKIRASLRVVFPEQVEGLPFVEWIVKMIRNGRNHISPRQVVLFLVILRDILVNSATPLKHVPIFSDTYVKQAITHLSELSFEEILSDFRVAPTFIRNCRAGKISEFSLDEVKALFSEQEGTIVAQIDILEKLGILERIIQIDSNKGFISKFRFPEIYTRGWYF